MGLKVNVAGPGVFVVVQAFCTTGDTVTGVTGEKMPFEVTAVYPYLKRLSSQEKAGVSK